MKGYNEDNFKLYKPPNLGSGPESILNPSSTSKELISLNQKINGMTLDEMDPLVCALSSDEFNRVYNYGTVKKNFDVQKGRTKAQIISFDVQK